MIPFEISKYPEQGSKENAKFAICKTVSHNQHVFAVEHLGAAYIIPTPGSHLGGPSDRLWDIRA